MALAAYKDLCIDVNDLAVEADFWSAALGLRVEDRRPAVWRLAGARPEQTVWLNAVPEPKTVKQRVHLDVHAGSVEELTALGGSVVSTSAEDRDWTVLADPEGGELCAYVRDDPPVYRGYELVVDSADPLRIAGWWADVYGARLERGDDDGRWWYVEDIAGLPFECVSFVPVPEAKTVKNRVHWDVLVDRVEPLVAAGATVLHEPSAETPWTVLADPEGNEFCAFLR